MWHQVVVRMVPDPFGCDERCAVICMHDLLLVDSLLYLSLSDCFAHALTLIFSGYGLLIIHTDFSEQVQTQNVLATMSEGQLSLLSTIFPRSARG